MKVLTEPYQALPIVEVDVVFPGGLTADPLEREGLTAHTLSLMRRGAGERDRNQLDDAIDALGGSVDIGITVDAATVAVRCLASALDPMLHLVGDILTQPRLENDEHERLRRESLAMLDDVRDDDATLCQRHFDRLALGGHVYGRTPIGTEASLGSFSLSDVRGWMAGHALRERVLVGFAGAVEEARAEELAIRLTAGLASGSPTSAPPPPPPRPSGRRTYLVDKPERTQSQIMIGQAAPPTAHPDTLALSVAATCMGGTFSSRLMSEVRVKRGWSYGVSFRTVRSRAGHTMRIRLAPAAEQTPPALALVLELWEQARGALRDDEVELSKNYLDGVFTFDLATPGDRLGRRLDREILGLPADNDLTFRDRLRRLTTDDVNQATLRHWRPEDATIVLTGTAEELVPRLAGLPIGDITVVPYDSY